MDRPYRPNHTVTPHIDRPRPHGAWRFTDVAPRGYAQKIEVEASFAADLPSEPTVFAEGDEPYQIPNNITIVRTPDSRGNAQSMRLSRAGALSLIDALRQALDWDGT